MATTASVTELAVLGGPKTVTVAPPRWPQFSDAEIEEARQTMIRSREDWREACAAVGGGIAARLEEKFARWLGRRYAVGTCGGGAALHIACMAAGIKLGDEVITSPYSWGQTVSCILQAGGIPIFGDIDPERLTLDPAGIEPLITERTKAIVVVHIYGIPADMDAIMAIAARHNLVVIEDCAQAQGALEGDRLVGTKGHIGCFSIGSGKNIAAGDGGMLATDDRDLYEHSLLAGMHPGRNSKEITRNDLKEQIDSLIYTYRINTFTAAIAYRQMSRLTRLNGWRRKNVQYLREALTGIPGIRPPAIPEDLDPAWHMVPWTFVADDLPGVTRAQYLEALSAEGVPIGPSYVGTPIHRRWAFRTKTWWLGYGYPWTANPRGEDIVYGEGDCPVAERRCADLDMMMGGGAWYKNVTPLLDQIVEAFRKVTAQPERLREVETAEA
jgi:dTDP-4-amino-4,6-dideoxygalactose transaminase